VSTWKLYYDGGCNLCNASQLRFVRWASAAHQPIEADVLQSPEAMAKGYDLSGVVVEADGKVYKGSEAALFMLRIAPAPLRWFAWLPRFAFTRWIAAVGYAVVARFRYALFGRKACAIPSKK
jgi:predicted DCC family thiol-disulfide oxidoreductase YuxK